MDITKCDSILFTPQLKEIEDLPGGYEIILILLKLQALADVQGGKLQFAVKDGSLVTAEYAEKLNHRASIFGAAVKCLTEYGLMQVEYLDSQKCVYVFPVNAPVPGKSKVSDPKQVQRAYGVLHNVLLTPEQKRELDKKYENAAQLIDRLSIHKGKQDVRLGGSDYAWLLDLALQNGIAKESDAAKRYAAYDKYKAEALLGCPPPESALAELTPMQYHELVQIADAAYENEHHAK